MRKTALYQALAAFMERYGDIESGVWTPIPNFIDLYISLNILIDQGFLRFGVLDLRHTYAIFAKTPHPPFPLVQKPKRFGRAAHFSSRLCKTNPQKERRKNYRINIAQSAPFLKQSRKICKNYFRNSTTIQKHVLGDKLTFQVARVVHLVFSFQHSTEFKTNST